MMMRWKIKTRVDPHALLVRFLNTRYTPLAHLPLSTSNSSPCMQETPTVAITMTHKQLKLGKDSANLSIIQS